MTVIEEKLEWLDDVAGAAKRNELTLEAACRRMVEVRQVLDTFKAAATAAEKVHNLLRINKIPDLMDEEGISTVTYDGLGRVTLTSDLRARIPAPQRDKAYEWLEENGFGDLIVDTINPSTLKAFCKRQIKDGNSPPDELFSITPFSRASVTKV